MPERNGTGERQRLERALHAAREKTQQLDRRLHVKGDYGHGRGDPLVVGWEIDLALRQHLEKEIELLEAALRRMDEGNYEECRACGRAISPERQEALPYATLCVACAQSGQAELIP
jgi:RNA polymerase-binding transcription factor DksA